MALTISTPLTTQQGFEVSNAYGRVAVLNNYDGKQIEALVELFASEEAFEAGKLPIIVDGINRHATATYDYATGEKDILDLAHDMLIDSLADQGVTAVKSL